MLGTSKSASEIRTHHMLTRFIALGRSVSPAPRKTPAQQIDAPYRGYAISSIRRTSVPRAAASALLVSIPKTNGAPRYIIPPVSPMKIIPR